MVKCVNPFLVFVTIHYINGGCPKILLILNVFFYKDGSEKRKEVEWREKEKLHRILDCIDRNHAGSTLKRLWGLWSCMPLK